MTLAVRSDRHVFTPRRANEQCPHRAPETMHETAEFNVQRSTQPASTLEQHEGCCMIRAPPPSMRRADALQYGALCARTSEFDPRSPPGGHYCQAVLAGGLHL